MSKIFLASDNWAPAHPLVLEAVALANEGFAPAYGADSWTLEAQRVIQKEVKRPCKVLIVPTGTGSNVFGLGLACRRHESILCTDIAHINYQESGSAERFTGCKLLSFPHQLGKVTPEALLKKISHEKAFGKHSTSPRTLSIAQSTEVGTVYSLAELEALAKVCQKENLLFHIDGSRLYNAAASLNVSLGELVEVSQVDILSLGGTKNGLMGAEALLIFNEALKEGSEHLQKQSLQLTSKMRYLSAQYIPFFKNSLWLELANHANRQAKELAQIIESTPCLSLSYPVQTNQVFFTAPSSWIALIQEKIACHLWDHETNEIRLIASWKTSDSDIAAVQTLFKTIQQVN